MAAITGTSAGDRLDGTSGDDRIEGLDGDDSIFGQGGNDLVDAGAGNDGMFGHGGNDSLYGGVGNDQLGSAVPYESGDPGNDLYAGGPGNDRMSAGPGNDTLYGGDGNDRIFGDLAVVRSDVAGNDFIAGGAGSDSIAGGGGFDIAYFDLPRRAYVISSSNTTFNFPQSNSASASQGAERGVVVSSEAGASVVADFLIEVEELRFVDGRRVTDPNDGIAQVYRVFEAGLDRAPDPLGLNFWGAQITAGVPLNAFASSVAQSPEFQGKYGALDNTAFVQQVYQNVLGRAGEAAGVNAWVNALDSGSTRGDVLVGFANSQENVNNISGVFAAGIWDQDERAAQVSRLYDTAFNRLPDLNGFLSNKAAMDAGLSLEQLAVSYARSAEFGVLYGGPNVAPASLVNALYANTLNRQADDAGLSYWTGQIASGAQTREQVIVAFSESVEHQILMLPSIEGGVVFA